MKKYVIKIKLINEIVNVWYIILMLKLYHKYRSYDKKKII